MKQNLVRSLMFSLCAALMLAPAFSHAATDKAAAAAEAKDTGKAKAAAKDDKAKKAKAAKVKLVDINSASKAELTKLTGISEADADKIIAGRPYLSKANLVTHNIISKASYDAIKGSVIAKQNAAAEAKLKELEKAAKPK